MTTAKKTAAARRASSQQPTTETTAQAGKIGDNAATLSAAEAVASASGDSALTAKADQLKRIEQGDSKPAATKRFRVLPGQFVRKGGIRFTPGEAVDLTDDQARDLLNTVVQAWGDDEQDDDDENDQLPPILAGDGSLTPNPDTAEGAEVQKAQEEAAAAADAAQVANGLPSGAENK